MAMIDMIEAYPQKTVAVVSSVAFSMASAFAASVR
jgi:ATP-dependent protease ClpP protease subunit